MSKSRRQPKQQIRRYRMPNYSGLYRMANYSGLNRRYFNGLCTRGRRIHTTRCGFKIPVEFPCLPKYGNIECECPKCKCILPYVALKNDRDILVYSKVEHFNSFRNENRYILNKIRAFNGLLKKYGNKLPYYEQSFLDARYSSIRCIIDDNDIVTYYCLLNNMDTPTKFRPTFIPIDHRYIPEYIKKVLYLKCLQDNAVVTLASCFKKKKN